jgi:hypothetical protein
LNDWGLIPNRDRDFSLYRHIQTTFGPLPSLQSNRLQKLFLQRLKWQEHEADH